MGRVGWGWVCGGQNYMPGLGGVEDEWIEKVDGGTRKKGVHNLMFKGHFVESQIMLLSFRWL